MGRRHVGRCSVIQCSVWEREGAGLSSLRAASFESGAASPWSVAADWHRVVRDRLLCVVFPVRLWDVGRIGCELVVCLSV